MRPLARKAAQMIREQGGKVIGLELIERTLLEIGKEYRPGLIRWIRENKPDEWRGGMTSIEAEINASSLSGDDARLKDALSEYRGFFLRMGEDFTGPQGNLF